MLGVPVLPVSVPGAAVSPGIKTCSLVNGPAVTETVVDVAAPSEPLVNRTVMSDTSGCARSVKVATPPTAVTLVAPSSVPAPPSRVALTSSVSLVRRLPYASVIHMTGCCANATPAVATFEGSVAITSLFAAAGLMWNRRLRPDWPPLKAVSCLSPVRSILILLNVATPLVVAVWVSVPLNVPLPEVSASDTEALGTPTPRASVTVTCTAGDRVAPAIASGG